MSDILRSTNDNPLEDSILEAGATLESILCTEELRRRPSHLPDYEKENRALVALMNALADSPSTIFQTLADTILDITQCDSAAGSQRARAAGKLDGARPRIADCVHHRARRHPDVCPSDEGRGAGVPH